VELQNLGTFGRENGIGSDVAQGKRGICSKFGALTVRLATNPASAMIDVKSGKLPSVIVARFGKASVVVGWLVLNARYGPQEKEYHG
jgi:hypothetical protein